MPDWLIFTFVVLMIISAFMQAEDNAYKKYVSPALTGFCGIIILVGALSGNVPMQSGLVLFIALLLLAMSDYMFESSEANPNRFAIAMIFGVISGFTISILFNFLAYVENIPLWIQGLFVGVGIVASMIVYRYLDVERPLIIPVLIYLVQAVILLAGGLSSWYVGNYAFAVWGIFIFISDSLVGIRAFPNPKKPIGWLDTQRILFAIIVLYYSAQYALVTWAL